MFDVKIIKQAIKFLSKLNDEVLKKRLLNECEKLCLNPFPKDVKRVENVFEGASKVFRVRVGNYRILYYPNYELKTIFIFKIDKRSRVYE